MVQTVGAVLHPVGDLARVREECKVEPLETLAGKTIGFLNYLIRPNYDPLVDEMGRLLRERWGVKSTPRWDIKLGGRPTTGTARWKQLTEEVMRQCDAAVMGLGG